MLTGATGIESLELSLLLGDDFDKISTLLQLIDERQPDLVCTYRNLHVEAADYPYSLGGYLDVLTQVSTTPVLVMPHPRFDACPTSTQSVMAITDHLTGDDHLVSFATALTTAGGTLSLTHVEDLATFERYIETIGKFQKSIRARHSSSCWSNCSGNRVTILTLAPKYWEARGCRFK